MEIEYVYSFKENVFYTGMGMLKFYLWFIPGYFAYRFIKVRKSALNLVLLIVSSLSLYYWEYNSLSNKFVKIKYQPDQITLVKKSGDLVKIDPNAIERFWSISIGRGGGWSCYLLIKTAAHDYKSLIVRKRDHLCKTDADHLNKFYGKP